MKRKRDILESVAEKYGVSVQQVRAEIDAAIYRAMADPDPSVAARWAAMSDYAQKIPTAEEVIAYCVRQIEAKR